MTDEQLEKVEKLAKILHDGEAGFSLELQVMLIDYRARKALASAIETVEAAGFAVIKLNPPSIRSINAYAMGE